MSIRKRIFFCRKIAHLPARYSVSYSLPAKTDILMPVKAEAEPIMATVAVAEVSVLASSEILTEEENDALNQISQRFVSSWS